MNIEIKTDYFYNEEVLDYTMTQLDVSFLIIATGLVIFLMFLKIWTK